MAQALTLDHETDVQAPPVGMGATLALFGVPALAMFAGVHVVMPWFNETFGAPPFFGFFVALTLPLAGLLLASLAGYRREGRPWSWVGLRDRFRLGAMDRRTWLWTGAALLVALLLVGAFTALNGVLLARGIIAAPDWLPAFLAPAATQLENSSQAHQFAAAFGGLRDNWAVLGLYLVFFFFNIAGEELWWRGYVLPRQEAALGQRAWLAHGLLWWAFHAFKWWDLLPVLPVTLLISYVAQRRRSTTAAIVVHGVLNALAVVPILLGVLGL
jgi:membrane protease YdiL (CAAX protease family)